MTRRGCRQHSDETATFDLAALHAAIEATRIERGLSRAVLARTAGVASSTIARFAYADPATTEADGVLAMIRWLGVVPEHFVRPHPEVAGAPLDIAAPMVRADTAAMGLRPDSRTNIAALSAHAHRLRVPIAALTRSCES